MTKKPGLDIALMLGGPHDDMGEDSAQLAAKSLIKCISRRDAEGVVEAFRTLLDAVKSEEAPADDFSEEEDSESDW